MDATKWQKIKEAFSAVSELSSDKRADFWLDYDAEIRREVEKLLAAHDEAEDFIAEPFAVKYGLPAVDVEEDITGKKIDDYVILKKIGAGGMGTVYLAEREGEDFSHRVAIKLIKRGMDTNAVLRRFLMERQILAQLEHPNIARLFDGGSTADGLPYFVMEYVEGEPLRKFCEDHQFDTRERLEIFSKICQAVSYAHQKLIVHRDIKPLNIIVTSEGEPKLLDFGVAKLLSPDWDADSVEATATNFRLMTPEYASPEQLRGQPTTTATDVYSLGVVLYELLTGTRPFSFEKKNPLEIAESVLTSEPLRPSAVRSEQGAVSSEQWKEKKRPATADGGRRTSDSGLLTNPKSKIQNLKSLRGDLDNIILKAIRREPERRYASVAEFSEDINRYLNGLPVKATADSPAYRFEKFIKRHRTGVLTAAVVALLLITSTVVTGWQFVVAHRERAKAERRFEDVRGLAKTVLFDHYDRIKTLPGATEARAKLVSDAIIYLDKLAQESSDEPELQRELVAAYRKLGDIQGANLEGGSLRDDAAARENYLKALAIQESLSTSKNAGIEDERSLARLYMDIGEVFERENERPIQAEYIEKGLRIMQNLKDRNPNRTQAYADLARALWTWANIVRLKGDNDGSIQTYEEAAEIYEMLGRGDEKPLLYKRNTALTYKNIGSVYYVKGDYQKALEFYQKAFLFDKDNAANFPDNVQNQMDLSFSHKSLSKAFFKLNEKDKALEENAAAIVIQEKVFAADAKNKFAAASLLNSYTSIAEIYGDRGDFSKAEFYFQKCLNMLSNDVVQKINGIDKINAASFFESYGNFWLKKAESENQNKLADYEAARKYLVEAKDIYRNMQNQNILDPAYEKNAEQVNVALEKIDRVLPGNKAGLLTSHASK